MREAIAGLFAALVVVPMLIVAQFSFASRSWILDSDFYRSITADERLYEGWEGGASTALVHAAEQEGYLLDPEATKTALAASYKDAELARLTSSFAGDTVDRIRTLPVGGGSTLDLTPLKRDVQSRLGVFAKTYAASVRTAPPVSDHDLSVRPSSVSSDRWAALLSSTLSRALEAAPDAVPLQGPRVEPRRLPALRQGTTLGSTLDRSLLAMGGFTALIWVTCSMMARSRWRDRFIWLGSTLGFASFFPIAMGAVMLIGASPLAGAGSAVIAERLSGIVAEIYRAAGSDAQRIASVLAQALARVGRSFFMTGLISAAVAAALSSARFFTDDGGSDEHERG